LKQEISRLKEEVGCLEATSQSKAAALKSISDFFHNTTLIKLQNLEDSTISMDDRGD
jgi:hypothetical protein